MNDAPVVLAVILLASADPITWLDPAARGLRARPSARVIGAAAGLRRRLGAAPRRAAGRPACTRWPRIAVCVLAYSAGQLAHASGLLATYVAALVLGNSDLPHRGGVLSFAEGLGLARPDRAVRAARALRLAAAAARRRGAGPRRRPRAARWSARPLSVIAAATPFRVPWREQAFLSWSGLRGAVPIVLALIALQEGAPSAQRAGRRRVRAGRGAHAAAGHDPAVGGAPLGVVAPGEPQEIEVDAAPLDELGADLLQVRVPAGSRLRGVYLRELRLPRGATVSLVRARRRGVHPGRRHAAAGAGTSCWSSPRRRRGRRPSGASGRSTAAGRLARWHGGVRAGEPG